MKTAEELEKECQMLNEKYSLITLEDWRRQAIDIANQTYKLLLFEKENKILDKNLISLIARSIIFWNYKQKLKAFEIMWNVCLWTKDTNIQDSLCSVIEFVALGMNSDTIRGALKGIDKLDKTKAYGSYMCLLIRKYG